MQLDRNAHAGDEFLEQYAMGSLTGPQVMELEDHLLMCSDCQTRLEEVDRFVAAMRGAAAELDERDEARRQKWTKVSGWLSFRRFGWAMAVLALLVAGVAARFWLRQSPPLPPFAVALEASRGAEVQHAPEGRALEISLNTTGLSGFEAYQVEVVDATGSRRVQSRAPAVGGKAGLTVSKPLEPGSYYIRLYSPSRELLREYGLQID